MKTTKIILGLLCVLWCSPTILFAASVPAGLASDQLWFSKDPFFAGETVTVFALVYNSSQYRLSGTVELRDGTTTIATKLFSVAKGGGSEIVAFPWSITEGSHSLSLSLSESVLSGESGEALTITPTLASAESAPKVRFADHDVNQNGIPDGTEPKEAFAPKAEHSAISTLRATDTSTVVDLQSEILTHLPKRIVSEAIPVLGGVESFRVKQAKSATDATDRLSASLGQAATTSTSTPEATHGASWGVFTSGVADGSIFTTPFQYAKFFFLMCWRFVATYALVFYLLIVLLLFKIIRMVIRIFF